MPLSAFSAAAVSTLPVPSVLGFALPQGAEWLVIGLIGLLIFGKRLPEVGKSLGKGIVEFKKGLKGVEDEVSMVDDEPSTPRKSISHDAGHKFDPYTGKPLDQNASSSPPAQ